MNQKLSDFLLLNGNERIVDDRQELQEIFTHVHTHTRNYITVRQTTTTTQTGQLLVKDKITLIGS